MTEENEDFKKIIFVDFAQKILNLTKLAIIVTQQANARDQLIINVIIIIFKIKVILIHLHFTSLVIMIVIYF